MSTELRFDDQVAVITGAGGGLGKQYALLLASRGAAAHAVAEEIRQAGGRAVPDTHSVTTPEGGQAIIGRAGGLR